MTGKKMVLIIVGLTIIALILVWFWMEDVIVKHDIDRAIDTSTYIVGTIMNTLSPYK